MSELGEQFRQGIIVSCHIATEEESQLEILKYFVKAAERGGAKALRIEGLGNVTEIRKLTRLPLVCFIKGVYPDGSELITPNYDDIESLFSAGADIVAIDATKRKRPVGDDGFLFFEEARNRFSKPLWADVAAFREGVRAAEVGANFIATTLAGHTATSAASDYRTPDYELIHELSASLTIPVIAEGRIWTTDEAVRALSCGAYAVVVGSAITRPDVITKVFVESFKHLDARG